MHGGGKICWLWFSEPYARRLAVFLSRLSNVVGEAEQLARGRCEHALNARGYDQGLRCYFEDWLRGCAQWLSDGCTGC